MVFSSSFQPSNSCCGAGRGGTKTAWGANTSGTSATNTPSGGFLALAVGLLRAAAQGLGLGRKSSVDLPSPIDAAGMGAVSHKAARVECT